MEHKCEAMRCDIPVSIDYEDGSWALWARGYAFCINLCPFCGLKLESPNVEIEVSKRVLESWALWADRNALEATELARSIKASLND